MYIFICIYSTLYTYLYIETCVTVQYYTMCALVASISSEESTAILGPRVGPDSLVLGFRFPYKPI